MKKLAYNYPAWHNSEYREWFNEWSLLVNQRERFDWHLIYKPNIFYDDTDPIEIGSQIQLAASSWLDGFVVCYYFDGENEVFNEWIDLWLLPAIKKTNFLFSLLLSPRLPRKNLPLPLDENDAEERRAREVAFWRKELYNVFHKILSKYSSLDNYYKINGDPVVFLFQYYSFFESSDLTDNDILNIKKEVANYYWFSNIFLVWTVDYINKIKQLSYIDAYTSYNNLPDYDSGSPIQDYQDLVKKLVSQWCEYSEILMGKYSPSISTWFDSSSRWEYGKHIPLSLKAWRHYPWFPIIKNFDMASFEYQIIEAHKLSLKNKVNFIMYCAWNEWSEGCILLEDTTLWTKKLDILKKVYSRS